MGNYKLYNTLMHIAAFSLGLLIIFSLWKEGPGTLKSVVLILIPLGLIQLFVGLHFLTSMRVRSNSIKSGIRVYWCLTLGYFLILYVATRFEGIHEDFYWIYLLVVPWSIALYQYRLVQKSYRERKGEVSKRSAL